uniref:Ovule protein n=1 Tax=Romanomermis culicivorax TaxID=13658 RepID=A0A915HGS2_ROMCU
MRLVSFSLKSHIMKFRQSPIQLKMIKFSSLDRSQYFLHVTNDIIVNCRLYWWKTTVETDNFQGQTTIICGVAND